ncbi:transmembrane protein 220 [Pelobates fuscus]|uniref:transmembrane protein 220 n=1 Tax=Pelobates fuscus TaxID=191477 RepID=UPI002FE48C66
MNNSFYPAGDTFLRLVIKAMETRDTQGSDRKQNLSPAGSVSCVQSQQRLWRVCNGLIAVFFGLAAYVQKNDPDAELWIALYLIPAFLILLVSVNPYITGHVIWSTLADLHTVICVSGAGYLLGQLYLYRRKSILHEEEGRELSGLMIIAVWLLLCRKSEKSSVGGFRLYIAVAISMFPFIAWLYIYIDKEMRTSWPQHCKTVL